MAYKRKSSPSASRAPSRKRFALSSAYVNLPVKAPLPAASHSEEDPSAASALSRAALDDCSQDDAKVNFDIGPVRLALQWLSLRGGDGSADEAGGKGPKKEEDKGGVGDKDDTANNENKGVGGEEGGATEDAGNAGADDGDSDSDSVNSDWVPWMERQGDSSIEDYRSELDAIADYHNWITEKRKLHQLFWMRGRHPVFPATWEYNFLMWGLPQKLYKERGSRKRVAISHKGDEFRATKAFEPLMDLSIKIADYDWVEKPGKTKEVIVNTLQNYITWAIEDAGVADRQVDPIVKVYHYSSYFGLPSSAVEEPILDPDDKSGDGVESEGNEETKDAKGDEVGEDSKMDEKGEDVKMGEGDEDVNMDKDDEDDQDEDEVDDIGQEQLLLNIQDDIEVRMQKLAQQHRDKLADDNEPSGWKYIPPVLFGYAVINNTVLIVCLDGSDPEAKVSVLEKLSLASPDQWLWNAITLAIPINFARDYLYEIRDHLQDKKKELDLDDPDA
ncbi:hypothetical protein GQ53DRAFT_762876 [Thozetella sp. PMI_491]|nr:hypothetical protein GQ53DRAFT_762876 [Thozetella sp. PMI_491]